MKTTKQVIEASGIPAKLVRSVIRQLGGKEALQDITNHGINGSFNGFIYYVDTVAFFKRNRKDILSLARNMADDLGEDTISMIAGFNCLAGPKGDKAEYIDSIGRCLYGRITDDDTDVANALAWFAGEEVARAFCDE